MDRLEPPELVRQARARADALATGRATSAAPPRAMPDAIVEARSRMVALRPRDLAGRRRSLVDRR